MIFQCLPVGDMQANCYIVGDQHTLEVAIVDPGDEGEKICNIVAKNQYKVRYIIVTHGHTDHIAAVNYVKEKTGAKVIVHKEDYRALLNARMNLSLFMGKNGMKVYADKQVEDGNILNIGKYTMRIIHTPGHTPGGICILIEKVLLSGDTLFQHSIGRTDLPGGNHHKLFESIQNKLMILSEDTVIYPGHGQSTTIGEEKRNNPYL